MSSQQRDDDALKELHAKLDQVLVRLDGIESKMGVASPPPFTPFSPPAPPRQFEEPDGHALRQWDKEPPVSERYAHIPKVVPDQPITPPAPPVFPKQTPPAPSGPTVSRNEREYVVGARALPIFGALLVIAAVGSGIALAIQSGRFGPLAQFWGLIALNFVFLVSGFRMRNEREEFGKVLMATGSVGIYLTLAGGHAFQHLYSSQVMTSWFFAWGLANLVWSYRNQSKTFLILGHLGGLVAAGLPYSQGSYNTGAILALVISLSSIPGAIRLKNASTVLLLTVTGLGMSYIMSLQQPGPVTLAAVAVQGVACMWAWSTLESKHNDHDAIGLASIIFLGSYFIWIGSTTPLSHVGTRLVPLLFGALTVGYAHWSPRRAELPMARIASWVMLLGGSFMTLDPLYASTMVFASGTAVAAVALYRKCKTMTSVAAGVLGVGVITYAVHFSSLSDPMELSALAMFVAGTMTLGFAARSATGFATVFPALAICLPAIARFHRVSAIGAGQPSEQTWMYATWGFALLGLGLAWRKRGEHWGLPVAALVATFIAHVSLRSTFAGWTPPPVQTLLQTLLLSGAIFATWNRIASICRTEEYQQAAQFVGLLWLNIALVGQGVAICLITGVPLHDAGSQILIAAWVCAVNAGLGAALRRTDYAWAGLLTFAMGISFSITGYEVLGTNLYPSVLNFWMGFAGVVVLLSALFNPRLKPFLMWPAFLGLGVLISTTGDRALSPFIASNGWVMTGTFAALGTSLVISGLALKEEILRYGGLGFFLIAVAKAAGVDLFQHLDATGRILGSLVIGCILIGTGYLYIRQRNDVLGIKPSEPVPSDEDVRGEAERG